MTLDKVEKLVEDLGNALEELDAALLDAPAGQAGLLAAATLVLSKAISDVRRVAALMDADARQSRRAAARSKKAK